MNSNCGWKFNDDGNLTTDAGCPICVNSDGVEETIDAGRIMARISELTRENKQLRLEAAEKHKEAYEDSATARLNLRLLQAYITEFPKATAVDMISVLMAANRLEIENLRRI